MMTRFALCARSLALTALMFATATPAQGSADGQIGTLTRIEGAVTLLSDPSKNAEGEGPRAKYDGEYYRYRQAKEGDRVEHGNVLRTNPGAKARIIYDNGDQYTVGDGTEFRIKWNRAPAAAAATPEISLLHGKIRAVIAKDGPRNKLNIRTRSATMGVRGTDFFVSSRDAGSAVEVAVIRGAVEVQPRAAQAKPVKIEKGQTAAVTAPEAREVASGKSAAPAAVRVEKTTKEELAYIQTASKVGENRRREIASSDVKLSEKIEKLEKKAVDNTLRDIKTHDPELYAKLDTGSLKRTEDVNAVVVTRAIESAPAAPENRKPFGIDLDTGDDVYKKYFNMD